MEKKWGLILIAAIFLITLPIIVNAQDSNQKVSIRTLPVDWYKYSGVGVKLQYRNFNNEPIILYLLASFENKYFRFVEAPPNSGSRQGLPVLIVHMKGNEVAFIDIYTQYGRPKGLIGEFSKEDLEKFKKVEEEGKIVIKFQ